MKNPVLVIGEGWAATAAAAWLGSGGIPVCWISGSGSRLLAPLPFCAASPGVGVWAALAARLEIETGASRKGCFLREYRGKGFREPAWAHAPTPGDRAEVLQESLWGAERRMTGVFEEKFESISLLELEEQIRAKALSLPQVTRIEGNALTQLSWSEGGGKLKLSTGEEMSFDKLIYADRWNLIREIEGLPKTLLGPLSKIRPQDIGKKFKPQGALQLILNHEPAVGAGIGEGFLLELTRESGEEIQRHVWGGFHFQGKKSLWTIVLSPEEVEDNHAVAKRLRRIKQALNRVFAGSEWIGGKKEFTDTVVSETVRLEQEAIFGELDTEPSSSPEAPLLWAESGISFLTDSYGPAVALEQVAAVLGIDLGAVDERGTQQVRAES